ncbi:extensin family protein [Lichenibacterium ramalinae]|uniref:Extensin n=1 Tax=Lichenibacterium ramalinae TaxID=2316527 RepID=A0A4Q2RKE7_9HYPH|nr:extensin family protein [Lichenibacterium ramalinae]RYB07753.1 extensin [Lichenibacterium ramalinae]
MWFRCLQILIAAAVLGALAGCSDSRRAERPPWRAKAEAVCLAKGLVSESASIRPFHEMSGPGICGAEHPFKVTALDGGSVALNATQTLDCPMIAALDAWVRDVVQPAAQARFGERVVRIDSMGSYNCRGINNMSGAGLSEHSFANAIDVGGFTLASGRTLNIMRGFNGADEQERAFLHEAHAGACGHFTTVLGPGYNIFHYNHFHLDLALHGATSRGPQRYCKPVPQANLPEPPVRDAMPDPPAVEEEMDIARTPLPEPALRSGPATLLAELPADAPGLSARRPRAPALAPTRSVPDMTAARAEPLRAPRPIASEPAEPPLISFGAASEDGAPRPPRATAPARSAGAPKDWDVTSSIGR